MKILDFVPYYRPHIGGLEKFAEELHQELLLAGDTITVFTPNLPPSQTYEIKGALQIIRYPAFEIIPNYPLPKIWKKEFWKQLQKISSERYDMVFSTSRFFFLSLIADLWARAHKMKRLHIEHGSAHVTSTPLVSFLAYIYDYTFGYWTLKSANAIVAPSASARDFVYTLTGIHSPVIYRGMPFEEIQAIAPLQELKADYPNKQIITYVGRLIHGKGLAVLLEALSEISRDDFILLIVGDGPEMKNLKKQCEDQQLSQKVKFLGSKVFQEAMSILKASDIFVNPSFNEGLPTSVLEAAACQIPIVATSVGGTPEIVENKKSALLVPPHDSGLLAQALTRMLANTEMRKELSEGAYRSVAEKFQWSKNILAFRDIALKLIEKNEVRKKILHIITDLNVGGAETNLARLLPELEKHHDNVVCCLTEPGPISKILKEKSIPVYYTHAKLRIFDFLRPAVVKKFFAVVEETKPDIAITYLIHADLFGRFWGKMAGIQKVFCWHRGSLLQWEWLRFFDRFSSFLVWKYIFQTDVARKEYEKILHLPKKKTMVIGNAVILPNKTTSNRNTFFSSLGLPHPDDMTLICVSNLRKGKGHPILLRAFEKLFREQDGRVNLLIIGDGEQRPLLETLRAQMKSKDRIFFLGHRSDVPYLLLSSDIFVLPTFYEGMSNAILEAMSIGCPVVSTDIAVNREIINSHTSGILVPIKDVTSLKNALKWLAENPDERKRLSENAKSFVKLQYSSDTIARAVSQAILTDK